MKYDIFLSHLGANKDEIIQFAQFLEPDISCWYAPRNILESETYSSGVLNGIESSKVFLVYLTEDYEKNPDNFVKNEVFHARNQKKTILPVLKGRKDYPRELEMHLNSIQWFRLDDYETIEEAQRQLQTIIQLLLHDESAQLDAYDIQTRVLNIPEGFIQISENLLTKNREVFLPTVEFSDISRNNSIHVFYGMEQSGKTIHAFNFLLERGKQLVFESMTVDSLPALLSQPLHEKAGYIIKVESTDLKAILSEAYLDQLSEKLKKANAEVILCTEAPVKLLNNYQIKLPQDKLQLIDKHITYMVNDAKKLQEGRELLKSASLQMDIHDIEDVDTLLEIVTQLSQTVEGKQTTDQFIQKLAYLKTSQTQLSLDTYKLMDLEDIITNLALSINHGNNKDFFAETCQVIKQSYQANFPNQAINYHMLPYSELKRVFQLEFLKETAHQLTGTYKEERVYYQNEMVAKKIWPIVWEEYGYMHEVLATTLFQMVETKKPLLANIENVMFSILQADFEAGWKKLINPLAKSSNTAENQLAKHLLIRLYEEPKYKFKILLLLKNWLFSRNKRLELTALLTLQSKIGIENFKSVLEWLLDLFGRKCSYPQAFYISLLYLSKYIYKNQEYEKYYYRTLTEQLNAWQSEEIYSEFVQLIAKIFKNHVSLFFESQIAFTEKFLVFIVSELVKMNEWKSAAYMLGSFLDQMTENQKGKLKLLLSNVKTEVGAVSYQKLTEIIKEG